MRRSSLLLTIRRIGEENRVTLMDWSGEGPVLQEHVLHVNDGRLRELNSDCERFVLACHLRRAGQLRREHTADRSGNAAHDGAELPESLSELGQTLSFRLLPKQVRDRLRTVEAGELELHVDARLVQLPWELCHDGQEFLAAKFHVGRRVIALPGELDAEQTLRQIGTPLRVLLVIDPTGTLPEAEQEGERLRALLSQRPDLTVTLIAGRAIRQERLLRALERHDIVHFAGHSVYDPQALDKSGWQLAHGVLKVEELRRLSRAPWLVFSNSCQAGATSPWGADGAALGIGSAFLLAGVKNYIGTFWTVHDQESQHFATAFYERLVTGADLGASLEHARQATPRQHEWQQLTGLSYMLYGSPSAQLWKRDPSAPPVDPIKDDQGERTLNDQRRPHLFTILTATLTLCAAVGFLVWLFQPSSSTKEKPDTFDRSAAAQSGGMSLEVKKLSGAVISSLKEGDEIGESDRFRLTVTPTRDLFLYVMHQDAKGNVSPLFPNPQAWPTAPVVAGSQVRIPEDFEKGIHVTKPGGRETIIVLGSLERLPGIETELAEIESGPAGESVRGRLKSVRLTALEAMLLSDSVYKRQLFFYNTAEVPR